MYDKHNKYTAKNQEQEILKDVDNKGKEIPWKEKKEKTMFLVNSYNRLGNDNKAYKVSECGNYLSFKKSDEGTKKLFRANFCKVRLCPMCSWRRSKKTYGQVSKVMNKALEDREYRFIFLTLTCRNVDGEELPETMDKLFKGFDRLFKRTAIKKAVKGWFRALEVTHNLDKDSEFYNTYHPHFHIILMVNKSYFNKPELYITQADWTDLWKESLQVEYTPIVDVRAFKTANKVLTAKAVAESAKYTVKDVDYLILNNEEMTDNAVMILDGALANRRLIAFGGELRKIHKALNLDDTEDGDLINTDNDDEIRDDVKQMIEHYHWHIGYKQYIKFEPKM